jgi:hypothetical protein
VNMATSQHASATAIGSTDQRASASLCASSFSFIGQPPRLHDPLPVANLTRKRTLFMKPKRNLKSAAALLFLVFLLPLPVWAGGVVTNCTESDLRAAMAVGGTVSFACDGTITLTSTIANTADTTLDGSGHQIAISGGGNVRVFFVASNVTFTILNLTILNGVSTNGGAIYNAGGIVNGTNCTFSVNTVIGLEGGNYTSPGHEAFGGAIHNLGTLNVDSCRFVRNSVIGGNAGLGGYAYNSQPGGRAAGGAICNFGTLTVIRSTFASNVVTGGVGASNGSDCGPGGAGSGGAIFSSSLTRLADSTLLWNRAFGGNGGDGTTARPYGFPGPPGGTGGAGIGAICGSVSAFNCTIVSNVGCGGGGGQGGIPYPVGPAAPGGNGGDGGNGLGGIQTSSTLTNCTVAFNSGVAGPGGAGGHGYPDGGSGRAGSAGGGISGGAVVNTLLATNAPGGNCFGAVTDLGHNLSSDATCAFTGPGSLNNLEPNLAPIADNGGPTLTMALLPGSPAIDAGDTAAAPGADQRGFSRPPGTAADIGAYEYGATQPILLSIKVSENGVEILGRGIASNSCRLLTSVDLVNWLPIATNQLGSDGTVTFHDNCDLAGPCHVYRLVMP